jgi:hypothetical protein
MLDTHRTSGIRVIALALFGEAATRLSEHVVALTGPAMAVLRQERLDRQVLFAFRSLFRGPEEDDGIGLFFDGAGVPQIGELRARAIPTLAHQIAKSLGRRGPMG